MILKELKLKVKNASLKVKTFEFHTFTLSVVERTLLLFSFYIFCFSASLGYAQNPSKQLSANDDKKLSHLLIAKSPTSDLSRQLWQVRISTSNDKKPSQSKSELQKIISQINSVEFKSHDETPEPLIVVEPIRKTEPNEPNEISSAIETPQEQDSGKTEYKSSREQVTEQTLQILSQYSGQLHNPFELAEILFNSNCLREAAKYYQQAIERMTTNKTNPFANKAWVLFQIGNCLRNTDPTTAMQMYKQLIAEYPDSPWVDLAKAKTKLIDWHLKDKPYTLINNHKL